ncbi:MAG: aminopeptidase PepB [Succinivibrio sp.]|nr:aminopeptidase PepB [Succinivibrio sp.]
MSKFNITNQPLDGQVLRLNLTLDHAPEGFREDCKYWPDAQGGYSLRLSRLEALQFAKAGRQAAALGAARYKLDSKVKLEPLWVYHFAQSLYDGVHDYQLEVPLTDEELGKVNLICELMFIFRALANTDSKTSTPVSLCKALSEIFTASAQKAAGCHKVQLITRDSSDYADCVGIRAVSAGSANSGCLGVFDYAENEQALLTAPEIVLVGKGITFDSGGYDLKPPKFMDTMRTDKTGAVNLMGALCLAIVLGLKRHVKLYLCCAENLVSANSMLPGDVITYPNGISVEITNTDAEGRLVLADGLIRASLDKPQLLVDAATLTGAAKTALGRDMCALFTRDNQRPEKLSACFASSGERCWQLPFVGDAEYYLPSSRATLANSGTGEGPGASTAAAFLDKFVAQELDWVHIDLSSAYLPKASQTLAAGPTGALILPLAKWLCEATTL